MAKIVQYREQVETPLGRGVPIPRATAPENIGAVATIGRQAMNAVAQGGNDLMVALKEREEETGRAWSANALSEARLQWSTSLMERQASAQPGAPDFTPSFTRDFDDYATKTIEKAPTPHARRYLTERLTDLKADLGMKALAFEAQARIDYRADQFNSAIQNTQRLMNTDPGQYQVALAEQLAVIDASSLPPVKKSELREKAITAISGAAVWSQIQKSPTVFLQSIGFLDSVDPATGKTRRSTGDLTGRTGNTPFDALPFEQRSRLFDQAIRMKAQIDTDAERAVTAERKRLADSGMQEAWNFVYGRKFKDAAAKIEQIRPLISGAEYRSLREGLQNEQKALATGAGQKTDPGAFRTLMSLVAQGKDDEATQQALTYHRNGLLSNEHLGSFVRSDRRTGPKTEYDMTRTLIARSMEPGAMVNDPVARSRQAEAIDTFDRWVKENKPNDEQIRKRGQEILNQYRFINLSDTVLALPMPRSGSIRRTPADMSGMQQDILRAGQEAQRRFASKQFNKREYEEEIEILNRWRKAIEQK